MVSRSAWFANLTDQDTPVATLTGMIIETVHQFVHDERRRSFCFLGKRSHCFMNQEDLLVVSPAELDDINTMRGRDRNGNSPFAPYTDRDWYTFHEPMGYDTLSPTVVLTLTEGGDCILRSSPRSRTAALIADRSTPGFGRSTTGTTDG
jgi:hypothetical protein